MPTDATSLFILIIAILPGLAGEFCDAGKGGVDRQVSNLERVLRLLLFSALGVMLYTAFTLIVDFFSPVTMPVPDYVFPERFQGIMAQSLWPWLGAYLGHWIGSAVAGISSQHIVRPILRLVKGNQETPYENSWSFLANELTNDRWVVVSLNSGDEWLGTVRNISYNSLYKGIILSEPYLHDDKIQDYAYKGFKSLYVSHDNIKSVAVFHHVQFDKKAEHQYGELFFNNTPSKERNVSEENERKLIVPQEDKRDETPREERNSRNPTQPNPVFKPTRIQADEQSQSTAEQTTHNQSTAEQTTQNQSTAEQTTQNQSTAEQTTQDQSTAEQGDKK